MEIVQHGDSAVYDTSVHEKGAIWRLETASKKSG